MSSGPHPTTTRANVFLLWSGALLGAVLLGWIGPRYRIDLVRCEKWPAIRDSVLPALAYLLAVALFSLAWLRLTATVRDGRVALALGLAVHAIALACPPFLSDDPLFYAALGRVTATFHQSPYQPLQLPANDPFFAALPAQWRWGTTPYFPGFTALGELVTRIAGDRMALHLRVYQLIGLLSMAAAALVAARAASPDRRASIVASTLLCPLAIIDGTVSAHNDGLLAVSAALFTLCIVRGRRKLALLALLSGVLVKASALILVGFYGSSLVFGWYRAARLGARARIALAIGAVLASAGLLVALFELRKFSLLLGSPQDLDSHCTWALECLPRIALRQVFHLPRVAFGLGLAFRAAGALWLLYAGWRAAVEDRPLPWAARALFFYYLFFHGWMQTWYFLPLLPLLPHATADLSPLIKSLCIGAAAHYALVILFRCIVGPPDVVQHDVRLAVYLGLVALGKGLCVLGPPLAWMLRRRFSLARPASGS